jgi:prepilin-type N-terminal cleavage/methylation domain-containing protein
MLSKLQKSDNKGFTIIEVMIVLAIAGLIILIVLLAVPALQRNSRNTAMKSDVSALTGAISEFQSNNDGQAPLSANSQQNGSTYNFNNASGTVSPARVQGSDAITDGQATTAAITGTAGSIYIDFGMSCTNGTVGGTVTAPTFTPVATSANARAAAIIYSTESSSGLQIHCADS